MQPISFSPKAKVFPVRSVFALINFFINFFFYQYFILLKKCPHPELFWSIFSRIQTEYGERRIQSECGKIWAEIIPNTDTFYVVLFIVFVGIAIENGQKHHRKNNFGFTIILILCCWYFILVNIF